MNVCILKILYFDRIDVTERGKVNKTIESKQSGIFQYYYYLNKGFKVQPDVCNGYHDS